MSTSASWPDHYKMAKIATKENEHMSRLTRIERGYEEREANLITKICSGS